MRTLRIAIVLLYLALGLWVLSPIVARTCPTPTPTPGDAPTPVPLNNPQVITPTSSYGGHSCGAADASPCFNSALALGDLQVNAGTYNLTGTGASEGAAVALPSGRNIRCGSGNQADGSVALVNSSKLTSWKMIIYQGTSGSIMGCQFRGPYYNTTTQPTNEHGLFQQFIVNDVTNTNGTGGHLFVANNEFNGIGGGIAAIQLTSNSTLQPPPNGDRIEFNKFLHCEYYAVQISSAINTLIYKNTMQDCNGWVEALGNLPYQNNCNKMDSNTATWVLGTAPGQGFSGNFITGGQNCQGNPCNNSGNIVTNNSCSCPGLSCYLGVAVNGGNSANDAYYNGNSLGTNCTATGTSPTTLPSCPNIPAP